MNTTFDKQTRRRTPLSLRAMMVAPLALMVGVWQVGPAWATIDNTVTVTGSSPGNTNDVTNTATENVDVVNAAPALTVTKVADDDTDVAVGQTVTYTYTVTNTGNVTMTAVSLADVHDGAGTAPTPIAIAIATPSEFSRMSSWFCPIA